MPKALRLLQPIANVTSYRVIPVNPSYQKVLGQKCCPALRDIPGRVDIVECFRKSEEIMPPAEDATAIGAKVLWMQIGDPHHGFARIYCDACQHEFLLAYACKTRGFCPSCHQKHVRLYGEWIEQNVLAHVAHRQYVVTLPKLLAPNLQPAPGVARRAVPHRRAPARPRLCRGGDGREARADPVRAELRGPIG